MTEEKLNKIMKCIYIIIALLVIDTIILVSANVKITTNEGSETHTETTSDYDVSMFKEVTMDEAIKLFDSSETKVIYIGRATCGYCVKFLPTLQQAQKEYGYKTYYYDMDKLTEEDTNKILAKDNDEEFLSKNFTATPMVLLVKDGKLADTWIGYSEYNDFAQFLEKNGFKK